ncbi:MAG: RseA family anti-sigma factor [Casimicrobiaceae bacterium]
MNEQISRLMDGDADETELARICGACADGETMATWVCYHVIGDALRGSRTLSPGFASRFAVSLDSEPTVVAPRPRLTHRLGVSWAIAATVAAVAVVGCTAVSLTDAPTTALARARAASDVHAAELRQQTVPADYLLAHQEYSPATAMQGVGPYLRAVSVPAGDAQR